MQPQSQAPSTEELDVPEPETELVSKHAPLIDLEGLLDHMGIKYDEEQTTDYEVWARCPQHKKRTGSPDRSPSWSINRETGEHYCFSCGYKGDHVQNLVMDVLSTDAWEAAGLVRRWGLNMEDVESVLDRIRIKQADEIQIHPESLLEGFVEPPTWALKERGITKGACILHGVLFEHDDEGWILPVRMRDGSLLGYQIKRGPWVRNRPAANPKKGVQGMQKGQTLFGLEMLPEGGTAILVESPLDVVRLTSLRIEGATAVMGQHPTDMQMHLLREHASDIIIALDNDSTGHGAADRLITKWAARITMSVFNYGCVDAKDPGDMSREEIEWALSNRTKAAMWRRPVARSVKAG